MKFREIEKIVRADGWFYVKAKGSHFQYKHPTKKGKVTIPNHGNQDLPLDTIKSIKRQAGLK